MSPPTLGTRIAALIERGFDAVGRGLEADAYPLPRYPRDGRPEPVLSSVRAMEPEPAHPDRDATDDAAE
jgi:hypothetical protein